MPFSDELDEALVQVLGDNTAQSVFKHLDRLEDNREALGPRWIWELLQNARDAARPDGVHVRIRLSDSKLIFEHDGKPFAPREIAHLVYHGSTKIERSDPIGQFGSGFLSTHLLSRSVRVCGCLKDSRRFAFLLDRAGDNVKELHCSMVRSWSAFKHSLKPGQEAPTSTSFLYDIKEHGQLAHKGVAALRQWGPLVLAFCPNIASISVKAEDTSWSLERRDRTPMDGGSILDVQCQQDGKMSSRFVAVAGGDPDLQVALQLRPSDVRGFRVDLDMGSTPKLFMLFPLIGSERLGLPASINSTQFKPREDRDGVVLAGESEGAEKNRHLLQRSMRYQERILNWCAREKWSGIERLLAFDTDSLPDWVDEAWFTKFLTPLVERTRKTRLVLTPSGDWITPQEAWIPTAADRAHREQIWELMASWDEIPSILPQDGDYLNSWARNLANWSRLLQTEISAMDEALTIEDVAYLANEAGSIEGIQERLITGKSLSWITSLLRLVEESGHTELFDEYKLLPSQTGCLRKRQHLRLGKEIPEKLKDIAEGFSIDVRNELLNTRVEAELDGIAGLLVRKRESELLNTILDRVRENCRVDQIDSALVPGVIKLFWWMVKREHYHAHLDKYPAPTTDEGDNKTTIFRLDPDLDVSQRPLAARGKSPGNNARPPT